MPKTAKRKISKPGQDLRWGVERRMEFIEFRLYWEGKINRRDLISQFGVSTPQASADFNRYQEMAPGNLVYETRAKHYYPAKEFKLRFLNPDSNRYLANLMSISFGISTAEESWLSNIPAYDILPQPRRVIDPRRLQRMVAAIRERMASNSSMEKLKFNWPLYPCHTQHLTISLGRDTQPSLLTMYQINYDCTRVCYHHIRGTT